jgi:hypothetical protein
MPVFRIADKHGEPPGAFMRQFQKAQKIITRAIA